MVDTYRYEFGFYLYVCKSGYYGTIDDCKDEVVRPVSAVCQVFQHRGSLFSPLSSNYSEDLHYWICLPLPNPDTGVSVSGQMDESIIATLNFSYPE